MIRLQCNYHPGYKAMRKPSGQCLICWRLWYLIEELVLKEHITVLPEKPK
jgi:hypothetical protein